MNLVAPIPQRARRDPLLRLPDVEAMVGLKKSTIYAMMKRGEFPQCVQVSARAVAWPESTICQFVEDRKSATKTARGGVQS